MKVIIIDDEPLARGLIKEYLQNFSFIHVVAECADGFEGLKAIQLHNPDLIFLDIQMPKINGFEMLELTEPVPPVIFTTAFDEYAIKAFEAHAIDYLLKPFSAERFDKAIQKCLSMGLQHAQMEAEKVANTGVPLINASTIQRVVVKENNRIKIIPINTIQYFASSDDYVKIHTEEGVFLKNSTMGYYESVLDKSQFVRIHRSFLVNVQLITRIDPYEKEGHMAILSSGKQLPVSKSGYGNLKTVLGI